MSYFANSPFYCYSNVWLQCIGFHFVRSVGVKSSGEGWQLVADLLTFRCERHTFLWKYRNLWLFWSVNDEYCG